MSSVKSSCIVKMASAISKFSSSMARMPQCLSSHCPSEILNLLISRVQCSFCRTDGEIEVHDHMWTLIVTTSLWRRSISRHISLDYRSAPYKPSIRRRSSAIPSRQCCFDKVHKLLQEFPWCSTFDGASDGTTAVRCQSLPPILQRLSPN